MALFVVLGIGVLFKQRELTPSPNNKKTYIITQPFAGLPYK